MPLTIDPSQPVLRPAPAGGGEAPLVLVMLTGDPSALAAVAR